MITVRTFDRASLAELDAVKTVIASAIDCCGVDHCDDIDSVFGWRVNAYKAYADADLMLVAGLKDQPRIAGVAAMKLTPDANVTVLYVHPVYESKGVARALMDRMEQAAKDMGLPSIFLESSMEGRPFYMNRGYREAGTPRAGAGLTWNFPMRLQLA